MLDDLRKARLEKLKLLKEYEKKAEDIKKTIDDFGRKFTKSLLKRTSGI